MAVTCSDGGGGGDAEEDRDHGRPQCVILLHATAQTIAQVSRELLRVEEGSLYPALHRMEQDGWIESQWKLTETNRKARFYSLTNAGTERLRQETENWERLKVGVGLVLEWAQ